MLSKMKRALNGGIDPTPDTDEERGGIVDEVDRMATSLSWETRLQGFFACIILGLICSLAGTFMLSAGKITGFCVLVSLGSVLSILSTCFLMGPWKQLQKMFDPIRLIATVVYIAMIALTVVAGLVMKFPLLAFIFTIGQYLAMAWYSISYIPFARDAVKSCFSVCIN